MVSKNKKKNAKQHTLVVVVTGKPSKTALKMLIDSLLEHIIDQKLYEQDTVSSEKIQTTN